MKRKFECHITCDVKDGFQIKKFWDGVNGWVYSQIDGDPLLGAKPYCYLTRYDTDGAALLGTMRECAEDLRNGLGAEVLREKIEEIIYDTKTGHDVLTEAS